MCTLSRLCPRGQRVWHGYASHHNLSDVVLSRALRQDRDRLSRAMLSDRGMLNMERCIDHTVCCVVSHHKHVVMQRCVRCIRGGRSIVCSDAPCLFVKRRVRLSKRLQPPYASLTRKTTRKSSHTRCTMPHRYPMQYGQCHCAVWKRLQPLHVTASARPRWPH